MSMNALQPLPLGLSTSRTASMRNLVSLFLVKIQSADVDQLTIEF